MSDEPISEEILEAARVRFCRRIASALIGAMAEADMSYQQIEARLRAKRGWAKKLIDRLIDAGTTSDKVTLRDISDFAIALGCEPILSVVRHSGEPDEVAA